MSKIAVLSHSIRMARTWLEVDHGARMESTVQGIFPNGDRFHIFTHVKDLYGHRDFDSFMEGPYVDMSEADIRELNVMRAYFEAVLQYRK